MLSGQHLEAQTLARRAVNQQPGEFTTWGVAAEVALASNRPDRCEQFARQAVSLSPEDPESNYLLGTALAHQRKYEGALTHLTKATMLQPLHWRAFNNLGNVLRETGRHDEALAAYERVFANPESPPKMLSNILLGLHFHEDMDHERQFQMHREVSARIQAAAGSVMPWNRTYSHEKIRLGYFSPRFKPGVIGNFFLPIFDAHDRTCFELHIFNDLDHKNPCIEYLEQKSDSFTETHSLSDAQFAACVLRSEIDIFIDLAGHSPLNRLGVFALKPAPIQVSMLDYFDTTGMSTFDFYITDAYSTPADTKQKFTERLIRLLQPRLVYRPTRPSPPVSDAPMLSNGFLTFGSFNRLEKITPRVIQTWAKILTQIPSSKLILKDPSLDDKMVAKSYTDMFRKSGVPSSRLEFRGWSGHWDLLAEYADIDMALDTFPYNGGLTTCESLWMGVPVLSIAGSRIISRQSACIMNALGLEEFVAESPLDFVTLATRWAARSDALSELRRNLRDRFEESSICDGLAFTRELEFHLKKMVRRESDTEQN